MGMGIRSNFRSLGRPMALALGITVAAVAGDAQAAIYGGNAASGFGGAIGNGSLEITESAGVLTFKVTPAGSGVGDNKVALYLDTTTGGVTSTSALSDTGDFGRSIITGGNSDVNFAAGFGADYAISINPNDFIGVFALDNTSNYTFKTGTGSAGAPFTVSVSRADLGLNATDGFSIVGSLVSGTFYRSNETFGTSTTTPETGAAPNAGFTGSVTFTSSLVYEAQTAVPEPATVGLLAVGGLAALGRRARRA